jgi:O-antigen ligase
MIRTRAAPMPDATSHPAPALTVEAWIGWLAVLMAVAIPLYHPWIGMAAVLMALIWIFGRGLGARLRRLRGDRLTAAVVAYFAFNLLSILWSGDRLSGLQQLGTTWYVLLVPILTSTIDRAFRRAIATVLVAATSASACLSILVASGSLQAFGGRPHNPSPTMHHIDFSLVLAVAALLVLVHLLYPGRRPKRPVVPALAWVVIAIALVLNIGRGGQLAFAVGLAVLVVHWGLGRRPLVAAGAALVAIALLAAAWFAAPALRERAATGVRELHAAVSQQRYDGSIGGRVAALRIAGDMVRDRPVFGAGLGGAMPEFRARVADDPELAFAIGWYPHMHNQYAATATETGLLGLLALAWIFWELVRSANQRSAEAATAWVLASTYLVAFVAEPFFGKPLTLALFALVAGLISSATISQRAPELSIPDPRLRHPAGS